MYRFNILPSLSRPDSFLPYVSWPMVVRIERGRSTLVATKVRVWESPTVVLSSFTRTLRLVEVKLFKTLSQHSKVEPNTRLEKLVSDSGPFVSVYSPTGKRKTDVLIWRPFYPPKGFLPLLRLNPVMTPSEGSGLLVSSIDFIPNPRSQSDFLFVMHKF